MLDFPVSTQMCRCVQHMFHTLLCLCMCAVSEGRALNPSRNEDADVPEAVVVEISTGNEGMNTLVFVCVDFNICRWAHSESGK